MIARLKGSVVKNNLDSIILDVNGVGYKLSVLPRAIGDINSEEIFFTHLYVREDQMSLYGFKKESELYLFELLISVSGIGPKAAMGILSAGDIEMLKKAIAEGRSDILKSVPGVGKKIADRAILELQGKISFGEGTNLPGKMSEDDDNVVGALVHLGYRKQEAQKVVQELVEKTEGQSVEEKVKQALKYFGS
jgi:Holliday junction DNA helicase RuvA